MAMVLVVVVVAVAALGSRVAGVLAAVSAAAWFDFFFTRPYDRFTIRGSADLATAVLLLVVGLAVSQLPARGRRLQVIAITDAGYLSLIHEVASMARSAAPADSVLDRVEDQLIEVLELEDCRSSTVPCWATHLAWSATAPS
jgi:K+-sensing histidine kinase KdpD